MSKEKITERINNQNASATGKKSHTGLILALVIVCILVGIILYLLLGKDSKTPNRVVTPENVDAVIDQLEKEDHTPVGSYEVSMNSNWHFKDGKSASTDAFVENSVANLNTVFFTIALKEDPDHDIYKSPYLAVGSSLQNITLDTPLDAGTYDTVITYHLVDESQKEISAVSLTLTITIEN